MPGSILQQHHEDQALNEFLLQFVNDNPEQAARLLRLAYEEIQVDEQIKRLEKRKVEIRKKTKMSAARALKQLQDYNTPGFLDNDPIGRNKESIVRNLMKITDKPNPPIELKENRSRRK